MVGLLCGLSFSQKGGWFLRGRVPRASILSDVGRSGKSYNSVLEVTTLILLNIIDQKLFTDLAQIQGEKIIEGH